MLWWELTIEFDHKMIPFCLPNPETGGWWDSEDILTELWWNLLNKLTSKVPKNQQEKN